MPTLHDLLIFGLGSAFGLCIASWVYSRKNTRFLLEMQDHHTGRIEDAKRIYWAKGYETGFLKGKERE